ncbi:hypothetical protein AA0117_g8656 [Alternaria alternata]|uniref:Zn(2)-C6 fungal-type domain-containing protein n=1 Tax=Alternaria alternata TaxID=5599 RepID=A0A4Q4N907_ALTAL|nr:hypothetical protein AA0117_g8656 [Alternaria alternata]
MPPTTSPTQPLRAGSVQKRGSKPVACQRCHSRKVKCSGGHPCSNCRDNAETTPCVYPSRDRQIKLSEHHLNELLKDYERLKDLERLRSGPSGLAQAAVPVEEALESNTAVNEAVRNPLLEDRPWFHAVSSEHVPIHVGEAADAAFATRFRQTLAVGNTKHLPRMDHVQDDYLMLPSQAPSSWPSPARARFLVKVALSTVCQYYHIVRKSQVTRILEDAIKNNGNGNRVVICKLLALFALGEVYSAKHASMDAAFPGLAYFAQARRMISIPAERPQMDTIEVTLLLVLYSFTVNRRHSAYIFASSACRLGLIMGMNMNIPEHQCPDRLVREHRVRLWWSAYALDRSCASKLGLPVSVADEDIMVDFPSSDGLDAAEEGDFGDTDYSLNSIKLAKLAARLTRAIYSRRNHHDSFSKRVQAMLKDLTKWMDDLPVKFHLEDNDTSAPIHIVYIHLRFNQCCILATRPILLHVLRSHKQSWSNPTIDPKRNLPEGALALAETCIQCARHSYRILTEAWIHGSLATLDYFDTQYLFSATTVLAISSLLQSPRSQADGDDFNNAVELLRQLAQSGNYGAKEFVKHMDAIEQSMQLVADTSFALGRLQQPSVASAEQLLPPSSEAMTAGMALADPSLRYFLSESDLDLQAFSNPAFDELQTPYWWADGWGVGGDI